MTENKKSNIQMINEQIPEVYANVAMVNTSLYEFEITLGLGSSNYQGVKPVVNLRLSPQFAKEFSEILSTNVALYEENHGKIKLPMKDKEN